MRYFLKETIYFIGAICSIYAVTYLFVSEKTKCQLWVALSMIVVVYIAYRACKIVTKRKNAEIKKIATRKKELETAVLGDERLSSKYNPDDHL